MKLHHSFSANFVIDGSTISMSLQERISRSIHDIVGIRCKNLAESTAVVVHGTTIADTGSLSFTDTWECIHRHELWLQQEIADISILNKNVKDVVIAYLSVNSIDMLLSLIACTKTSLTPRVNHLAALLNIRWSPEEMAKALISKIPETAATIVLYGESMEGVAKEVSKLLGHTSACLPLPKFSLGSIRHRPLDEKYRSSTSATGLTMDYIEKNGDDRDAMIVFTSGTTGGSKGVRLSHRAIAIQSVAKLSYPCEYSTETIMLASTVSLFHIGGISSCLAVLLGGGTLVFPDPSESRFDPNSTKIALEYPVFPINTLVVVPAMLTTLCNKLDEKATYQAVRLILIGGQSVSPPMIRRLVQTFPNARLVQTYACTEAASSLTFWHVNAPNETGVAHSKGSHGDCVGYPPSHVHLRLYRKEGKVNNIVTLPYQTGMIATRGPHLMNGYWSRDSLQPSTKHVGWYLTSDWGFFDEQGRLYFCGRAHDSIRSGGETIMAQEVERVLQQHPDIQDCAVFGKPDDRFGEAVACAVVTGRGNNNLTLAGIKNWCDQHALASYKRPRYLFLVKELPRNDAGKLLKHKLVQEFGRIQSRL